MGRRRWRFVTIAAFLLFIIKDTQCQDENDFYYTPVERSFAQVQPPLFPNSRPSSFYEHGDSYRVAQAVQQPHYNEGHTRFPSPNYNQNPSPFQLPTGRSQSGAQYYVNQPEFTPQRQRFRPSLPYNYQIHHPASTNKPDASQIHSVAYQNDPSKPETFLGQITLNNPDIDYLQNSRFKNIPFDGNSLKINGQTGHIAHNEDIDNDNQDLFEHHRVTTYNPNNFANKPRLSNKPNGARFSHFDSSLSSSRNTPSNLSSGSNKPNTNANLYHSSSTEYKALLDIEPLLEDDISDITSFRELMKNKEASHDVQVIKSNYTEDSETDNDNKPDASSMNADNILKSRFTEASSKAPITTSTISAPTENSSGKQSLHDDIESNEDVDDGEYVEYYDDSESPEIKHTTTPRLRDSATEYVTDIYDEYDTTEEPEKSHEETKSNVTESFDVLVMKPASTMVKDDNFKHFVDTTVIDQTDQVNNQDKPVSEAPISNEDFNSMETPSILGQEVVSVVTTKSVVNGTISIPDVTFAPTTAKISSAAENTSLTNYSINDTSTPVTTENWIVLASVQTSRSVSGARFLPFPTVEQEEKKQILTDETEDEDENEESVTRDPREKSRSHIISSSTENINDKLDSIQSELSSAVLSGSLNNDNKNIELITESTTEQTSSTSTTTTTTTTMAPTTVNVFTLKSTQVPSATEKSSPNPLPVMIKKFAHRITTSSTTPKPRKKPSLVTVMDDLSGLLPPGYKPRLSFKVKRTSTTTTPTTTPIMTTTMKSIIVTNTVPIINGTQGRSSGISSKNKVIVLDDKSLLPKEYRPKEHKLLDDIFKRTQKDDLSKLLPPGYKPVTEVPEIKETTTVDIFEKVNKFDISSFLPKGFNLNNSITEKPKADINLPAGAISLDLSALLPPGFKLNSTEVDKTISKVKVADVASLLPPGFKINETEEPNPPSATTKAPGGIKLVFPSRPGGKLNRKATPKPIGESGPSPVTPRIKSGWPVRASTEFTGWPSPSTTPFSIEKLLEAQRNATATSPKPELNTEATTQRITTTTTTTQAPPPSTTPGVCRRECDIAATIKIVAGVKWIPEFLDRNTEEWQQLANDVKDELNSVYGKSDYLSKWYKGIRIDGFAEGSVLVDYFIELNEVQERVDTQDLKKMFHRSLNEAQPGTVIETITESSKEDEIDPDAMLGDQPDEDRMRKSNEKMTKTIDKSAGKLEIGKFVMDPAYTEFIVLPKREEPTIVQQDEESLLPQWGIAVIVIALASLLFVVIFGVTVLVNRQKSAKAKQPIPLSEDMLRELDKSHMGGYDDMHQMKERDLPYLPSGKRMSTAFIEQLAYPNPGDSWRSEWTPQLQKYMQHYTPDSGRGSQIYGPVGNAYGYGGGGGGGGGGSQLYGQTGGGSQVYGYTGEYPRSHFSRRRSDYDSNF